MTDQSVVRRISIHGEQCGNCHEPAEYLRWWGEEPKLGDMVVCLGCAAVHEIVEDGIKFTGEFDRESANPDINRVVRVDL